MQMLNSGPTRSGLLIFTITSRLHFNPLHLLNNLLTSLLIFWTELLPSSSSDTQESQRFFFLLLLLRSNNSFCLNSCTNRMFCFPSSVANSFTIQLFSLSVQLGTNNPSLSFPLFLPFFFFFFILHPSSQTFSPTLPLLPLLPFSVAAFHSR